MTSQDLHQQMELRLGAVEQLEKKGEIVLSVAFLNAKNETQLLKRYHGKILWTKQNLICTWRSCDMRESSRTANKWILRMLTPSFHMVFFFSHSICLLSLKNTHDVFWWETLICHETSTVCFRNKTCMVHQSVVCSTSPHLLTPQINCGKDKKKKNVLSAGLVKCLRSER